LLTKSVIVIVLSNADSSCIESAMLWDLCNALWGSVVPRDAVDVLETSYICQLARRRALSQWLTSYSASHINTEVQSADLKVVCLFHWCFSAHFSWWSRSTFQEQCLVEKVWKVPSLLIKCCTPNNRLISIVLHPYQPSRSLCFASQHFLQIPLLNTYSGQCSFSYAWAKTWKNLWDAVTNSLSSPHLQLLLNPTCLTWSLNTIASMWCLPAPQIRFFWPCTCYKVYYYCCFTRSSIDPGGLKQAKTKALEWLIHQLEKNCYGEGPSWNVEQKQKYVEIERRPLEPRQKLKIFCGPSW